MQSALVIIVAYLIGSIPFGYLIVRATKGADVRETGSGGTGATNVLRRAGKVAGALTLVLDTLKGVAAIAIARGLLGLPAFVSGAYSVLAVENAHWLVAAAAIAAIVGHIFPVWLRFRGGKGVATGVGVFLMLAPIAVVFASVLFVLIVWRTRYVSLASILAALTIPVFVLLQKTFILPVESLTPIIGAAIAGAALIVLAHRHNIERLIQGTESRFK